MVVVLLLKNHLGELLSPLAKLQYGDFQVEFGRKVLAAEASANERLPELEESRHLRRARERILKIIPISPKSAIIDAWRYLESVAFESANAAEVELDEAALKKPMHVAEALKRSGIIDQESQELFNQLRRLRNEAVHHDQMTITQEEALSYLNTALKLSQSMTAALSKTEAT
jgi:uncharacterized protein YutE (UPF0331/DUF86 family)